VKEARRATALDGTVVLATAAGAVDTTLSIRSARLVPVTFALPAHRVDSGRGWFFYKGTTAASSSALMPSLMPRVLNSDA
jgi:hypothetical protein